MSLFFFSDKRTYCAILLVLESSRYITDHAQVWPNVWVEVAVYVSMLPKNLQLKWCIHITPTILQLNFKLRTLYIILACTTYSLGRECAEIFPRRRFTTTIQLAAFARHTPRLTRRCFPFRTWFAHVRILGKRYIDHRTPTLKGTALRFTCLRCTCNILDAACREARETEIFLRFLSPHHRQFHRYTQQEHWCEEKNADRHSCLVDYGKATGRLSSTEPERKHGRTVC